MTNRTGEWHKSSYSGARSECVEVKEGARVLVRDTRHRELGHLGFVPREWAALVTSVRVAE
ncbi:DUF397 domain-containing protein [Nocardiopsis sp. FIRDI 009]|uniref:DUF397 domain-containing protein n=1 Tax=Nocardiopsis sp. FIRDI 009 TaxID=714197 RepID=UPI000E226973|nr:DUF397 domain-containing protein [Nocardiopsis sp. FIRDI 009]